MEGTSFYFGQKHLTNNAADLKTLGQALQDIEVNQLVPQGNNLEVMMIANSC